MLKPKRHSQHYVLLLIITISLFCWYNMGSKSEKTIIDASAEYKDYHSSRVAVRKFTDPIVECPAKFGKIMIFVVYRQESVDKGYYGVALESLRCYLKGRSYTLQLVDIDKDSRVQKACGKHKDVFFKKHCAAAEYLTDTDYMLVLDADTGVVNPHHCIEDWIDERTNLMFYVRVLNSEIVSANYMARNSRYSHEFLKKWADWEFQKRPEVNGGDNAVLQLHLLQHVVKEEKAKACEKIWRNEEETADYWQYTTCVQEALGPIRYWPNKIRIYRKTLGWARDGFITSDRWGPADFMLHGWKRSNVGDQGWFSPFKQNLNASNCGRGDVGWLWRPEKKTSDRAVQSLIYRFENSLNADRLQKAAQKVAPNVNGVQRRVMEDCYPFCDSNNLFT